MNKIQSLFIILCFSLPFFENQNGAFAQSVGIGSSTFTPGSMLSVDGNMSIGNGYRSTANGITNGLIVEGNVGIGSTSPATKLDVFGGTGLGKIQFDVSAVNPILILAGDATNGYYPSLDFRPNGASTAGGILQSYSSIGGLNCLPRGGAFTIKTDAASYTILRTQTNASHTAEHYRMEIYTGNLVTGQFMPVSAGDQRVKFHLYNTITESTPTNYERLAIYPDGTNNIFRLEAEKGGTGTLRNVTLQSQGGNVGIGTTAPTDALHIYRNSTTSGGLTIKNIGTAYTQVTLSDNTTNNNDVNLLMAVNGNCCWPAGTCILDGSNNGDIILYAEASRAIHMYAGAAERMTILSGGNVGIGTTNPGYKLQVDGDMAGQSIARFFNDGNDVNRAGVYIQAGRDDATGTNTLMDFRDGDGTQVGFITYSGTTTSYGSASDRRIKTDIKNTHFSLEDVLKIKVQDFKFTTNYNGTTQTGFIAQDLYNIYPLAVIQPNAESGLWTVDYGKLSPLLAKGIQDLNDKVEGNHVNTSILIKELQQQIETLQKALDQKGQANLSLENEVKELSQKVETLLKAQSQR